MVMVFNATFNNISVISWRSVLLVGRTGVLEKTTDLSQVTDKLNHTRLYEYSDFAWLMTASLLFREMMHIHHDN
jgi:hypothetical protein